MHDGKLSIIERAVQLAKSGQCRSVSEIRDALIREGYEGVYAHFGLGTSKQMKALIEAVQQAAAEARHA